MRRFVIAALLLLTGCVDRPGQPSVDPDRPLRIATWNMEHLAERDNEGCRPRVAADYEAMARYAHQLAADVVAFQEVESSAAAARVFPLSAWNILIEERPAGVQGGCRGLPGQQLRAQKVGFAIRRNVPFERHPDRNEFGLGNNGLRWGVDVTVGRMEPMRLLAIHLKSGCNSGRAPTDRDCDVLFEQLTVLESWIDARAVEGPAFAVLGDFNRRLASRGDDFWAEIDDGAPANADLILAAGGTRATCKARYSEFIDHFVLDRRAAVRMVPASFAEFTYGVPEDQHPSDHCPVVISFAR